MNMALRDSPKVAHMELVVEEDMQIHETHASALSMGLSFLPAAVGKSTASHQLNTLWHKFRVGNLFTPVGWSLGPDPL